MNKVLKKKLIISIIVIMLGFIVLAGTFIKGNKLEEERKSYMYGFSCGLLACGSAILITAIRGLKNPKKGVEMENSMKDERLIGINDKALGISFRITIFTESIISVISSFTGNMELAKNFGLEIGLQLIVYLVTYFIIAKKN